MYPAQFSTGSLETNSTHFSVDDDSNMIHPRQQGLSLNIRRCSRSAKLVPVHELTGVSNAAQFLFSTGVGRPIDANILNTLLLKTAYQAE